MALVSKDAIRHALTEELARHDEVLAFWEAGSLAMGRADEWSDLDMQILTRDGAAEAVQSVVEDVLRTLGTIDAEYVLPAPTWHGHVQVFYRLAEADPLWLVDLVIMEEKSRLRFLEPELHGRPVTYIDRPGVVRPTPADADEFARVLQRRIAALRVVPELFHRFVEKELWRGRPIDALASYQGLVQRVVEALRILHCPWRYNFGLRYLQHDLPPEEYARVLALVYVGSPESLLDQKADLMALLAETVGKVERLDLMRHLEDTREGRRS